MKTNKLLRAISLLVLMISLLPAGSAAALDTTSVPPTGMFQLPWEQGLSWMAIDGLDNGTKRPMDSSHQYTVGGAIDFAPHKDMSVGENTSNFWVTAAAGGLVTETSFCHVKIDHGNGWGTEYQFLAKVQVKKGDLVFRNQRLGTLANGTTQKFCPGSEPINVPHLHFMLRPNLRNATFSGWQIGYVPLLNKTSFTKGDKTLGLNQLLLNALDLEIVLRGPLAFDTIASGSVDTYHYEKWSFELTQTTKFTLTANSVTTGFVPLIVLLDANGNEITRAPSTLTSTLPAGSYFVQIQPQTASGFYGLLLKKEELPVPTGPYSATVIAPDHINIGETASATVSLGNVPAEGFTSAEFTCTYDPAVVEASNITAAALFGGDPAVAISGPQNGSFILAIAGSNGNKALTGGTTFTFSAKGLAAGQSPIECTTRISKGDNVLTQIEAQGASLTVGTATGPTPTFTPTAAEPPTVEPPTATFTATPTATATNTPPASDWLTFVNTRFAFQFQYPKEGVIEAGRTDNFARIDLPRAPGTNLGTKYMDVTVVENPTICQGPLATQSMLETSETVSVNGLSFLKQTGQDGSAGHINKWIGYSTSRDNVCVSLELILRAADPGNFATPVPVYDEAAERAVIGQIVATYTWLTPPTATATNTPTATASATETATGEPSPTATSTLLPTNGTLSGKVLSVKPVAITVLNADHSVAASGTANADGTFTFTLPAGMYTVQAAAPGFLSIQGSEAVGGGGTTSLPTVSLLAGDIDNNNVIDQFDAMTIGMSYNTVTPAAADLNNDGVINVLDLELLARNYRATGPAAWPSAL